MMTAFRRYRAPVEDGAILADPPLDQWPARVESNRRLLDHAHVTVGGIPLRDLRARARQEFFSVARDSFPHTAAATEANSLDTPLILAGHQPELSHPGVWVKHFALNGLARRVGGVPLNLVVDTDTLKSAMLRFPYLGSGPAEVRTEAIPFDSFEAELPYETRAVQDPELFRTFAERTAGIWQSWGYEPLLPQVWKLATSRAPETIGVRFTTIRRRWERSWGCTNIDWAVSRLAELDSFARFARSLLDDLPRFREVYNNALRDYRAAHGIRSKNHPAPDLQKGEAPFWVPRPGGQRERATARSDAHNLRPRALSLTLFSRLVLGDFFIHGIGGAKYDEVTDRIIREYVGIDPPRYAVLSATLHLPIPHYPHSLADARAIAHLQRDQYWNPQRYADRDAAPLCHEKSALIAAEPERTDRIGRRNWFHELQAVTGRLRPWVVDQLAQTHARLTQASTEAVANSVLTRRDYAWVLYPEKTIRPFLTRFL